ncbi:hypothetical protein OHB26_30480 [Nocardia sp. NBC_01503]|uniref:hypothetical protein n=1 Tax=Nocardia sp. NBC_01503 TaxID=2975997 RepID=UPI002E7B5B30|nr:hypothetical protein [Nocardia sp. NBC_01503]WTL31211.1 hypothetical protein OHB26_30480 [Nocardia sp. NBC_01503]
MSTAVTLPRPHLLTSLPDAVGIAYSVSWIAGLAVGAPAPVFADSGSDIIRELSGHTGAFAVQFLLTEGLPAIGLAVVSVALARATRSRLAARLAAVTGVAAALISFTQFLLGLALARTGSPDSAHLLFELVSRFDGVKMFLLAGLAVAAAISGVLPRWLNYTAIAMAVAIVASGIGYLFLIQGLATLAYVSGPLLLVVITGTGVVLGRKDR